MIRSSRGNPLGCPYTSCAVLDEIKPFQPSHPFRFRDAQQSNGSIVPPGPDETIHVLGAVHNTIKRAITKERKDDLSSLSH
ncbi:MAG TPA: hypothetical protein PKJ77_10135 [Thermodesulfobacteriota bacterium]|nr:hypothetical protein [Thermodesulfobacteriota bacterium]HOC39624.1 hypothetical protein [Thermodesulfobacteriota bacterium]